MDYISIILSTLALCFTYIIMVTHNCKRQDDLFKLRYEFFLEFEKKYISLEYAHFESQNPSYYPEEDPDMIDFGNQMTAFILVRKARLLFDDAVSIRVEEALNLEGTDLIEIDGNYDLIRASDKLYNIFDPYLKIKKSPLEQGREAIINNITRVWHVILNIH